MLPANKLAHYERLRRDFTTLLQELSVTWPKQDLKYVKEEVEYNEYGEALENLIAVGLKNGRGFTAGQIAQIEAMAAAMEMQDSPFLVQLRKA
jgi:transcription elongation GreA/GreB family factor